MWVNIYKTTITKGFCKVFKGVINVWSDFSPSWLFLICDILKFPLTLKVLNF